MFILNVSSENTQCVFTGHCTCTQDEFLEYLQTLSIEDIDWQTPDEAFKQFRKTNCLEWFPDCEWFIKIKIEESEDSHILTIITF